SAKNCWIGTSLTITFQVAVDALIAFVNAAYWREPSIVRVGSASASRQGCGTAVASDGTSAAKAFRTACGAVGARSFLQIARTFAERNERSSRKKSSRFLPQRKLR